ncbi:TetR/AcrR family transcriptional regulator [Jiangella rhizosphaerae]|uniref:TetR/AcrR family transcriptional regulator n=1 Tax=Jiangella rhizosphaerae TaxID=2293569 RepID=A0A418KGF3_9ACTN|nr:TetR/AcrR family transcriptional regulator [Jiangella rhizosphaerae]RIQ11089.1 TetR/AcrR family transcriptional regulator [Jiangella rhizosphaerae]
MPRTASETRSHVLQVAGELFYDNGIRATGVDHVAAEAGVAPTTLYRLFDSKDGLVGSYVERMHHDFQSVCEAAAEAAGPDPRDQILAIFDTVFAEVSSDRYRGCAMLKTLAEFPDPALPAHRNAVAAKSWLRQTLRELTGRLGVADPGTLADQLMLVLDGMHATGQSLGPTGPAKQARRLAETLLSAAAPPSDAL